MHSKIIIVGFGPAGIACAIQLKRMGLSPLILEKGRPGGMLINASLIENYPGFPNGITGEHLVKFLEKQAARFHLKIKKEAVVHIEFSYNKFKLTGLSGQYTCKILILATGTVPRLPESFPAEIVNKGLIHTDISELRKITGKCVAIIGAGDAAFDYAISLASGSGNTVHIFNRSNQIKALKILKEKATGIKTVQYHLNYLLEELKMLHDRRLKLQFRENDQSHEFFVDYLIFATGRLPAMEMLGSELKVEMARLQDEQRLFLIGDIKNGLYRQLSLAVGDGVKAAMEIYQHESNQQN